MTGEVWWIIWCQQWVLCAIIVIWLTDVFCAHCLCGLLWLHCLICSVHAIGQFNGSMQRRYNWCIRSFVSYVLRHCILYYIIHVLESWFVFEDLVYDVQPYTIWLIFYIQPLTCRDRINLVQHSQYHSCWCLGSLHRQDISTHAIVYVE